MEKPYYKAIILFLASDNNKLYRVFKQLQEAYMDENPLIKCFFVYGANTQFERKEHDLVYDDLKDTVTPPWMTMRVIRAMEYIHNNFTYDYLIRTNLSTFWHFDLLLKRLTELPKTNCLSGRIGVFPPPFVTGTGMIISNDLIPCMIKDRHLVNITYEKYVAEDRMLSEYFTNHCNVSIIPANPPLVFFEGSEPFHKDSALSKIQRAINNNHYHFRLKHKVDRRFDILIANLLCQTIYNKLIFNRVRFYHADV